MMMVMVVMVKMMRWHGMGWDDTMARRTATLTSSRASSEA
jgi:hypothetical protein